MQGKRVLIRPYVEADAPLHAAAVRLSAERGKLWLSWMSDDYPEEESLSWIQLSQAAQAKNLAFDYAIIERHSNDFLGAVALNRIDWTNRVANLGYWLRSDKAGRGLATEAVDLMVEYAFDLLELARIEIVVGETNFASRRVAEKLGAVLECLAHSKLKVLNSQGQAERANAACYRLLPEDRSLL